MAKLSLPNKTAGVASDAGCEINARSETVLRSEHPGDLAVIDRFRERAQISVLHL